MARGNENKSLKCSDWARKMSHFPYKAKGLGAITRALPHHVCVASGNPHRPYKS